MRTHGTAQRARLAALGLLAAFGARALADEAPAERGRVSLVEENDAFAFPHTDRWYTQGLELHYLSGARPATDSGEPAGRWEAFLGQQLFTPADLKRDPPDPADRPYAGWLYVGAGLLREHGGQILDHYELELGVVGPDALGRQTQSAFHSLSGQISPRAWDYQLANEPGAVLSFERKWRVALPSAAPLQAELIPELGASVGNVYDYAEAGALLRIGRGLGADYGGLRMRPALSGTAWFEPRALDGTHGWSLFVGAQVRAVARDLFLDGNTWRTSARVPRKSAVADLSAGAAWSAGARWRLDLGLVWRTREFDGQPAIDRYGSVGLSIGL